MTACYLCLGRDAATGGCATVPLCHNCHDIMLSDYITQEFAAHVATNAATPVTLTYLARGIDVVLGRQPITVSSTPLNPSLWSPR